ncbi:MAG: GatB/YqeY domain-containing protein [Gemmatimonadota bacterium]
MSTDLKSRVQSDLNQARKDRDKVKTLVLSTVLADLKNREIEVGSTLDEATSLQVVSRAIKQRRDAAEQMRDAGRPELADAEVAQADILQGYLPEQLDEEQVRAMVREAVEGGASQLGAVMGQLMPRIRGRFDGAVANRIAREELGT